MTTIEIESTITRDAHKGGWTYVLLPGSSEVLGTGRSVRVGGTIDEVAKLAEGGLEGRDKKKGHDIYRASLCAACHRYGNEGGSAGPDLTSVAGRFSVRDLAEAILRHRDRSETG